MEKVIKKKIKTEKVEAKKSMDLNPLVWEAPYNEDIIALVLYVYHNNERKGSAHVKSRGDVSGGGKKPWKQKGTGRARHGSSRSPIWVGGGVTFASNDRNYTGKINRKVAKKAVSIMLSQRLRNKELEFSTFSSKDWKKVREEMVKDSKKKIMLISDKPEAKQFLDNVVKVTVIDPQKLNVKHLVSSRNIIMDEDVVKVIEERLTNGK
ncbi:MAG: 50S ribosomal protein L4 [Candidatus Dojkabacteria bacterium]